MKKILMINNIPHENVLIEGILDQMNLNYSIYTVAGGKDALNVLMGSSDKENYPRTRKVRPDLILVNKELPDMTALEFLEILRKYYSLNNIQIFLLTTFKEDVDPILFKKLEISGYLQRPFEKNAVTAENFEQLRSTLSERSYLSLVFPVSINTKLVNSLHVLKKLAAKGKLATLHISHSTSVAVSCTASAAIIIGASAYINSPAKPSRVSSVMLCKPATRPVTVDDKATAADYKTNTALKKKPAKKQPVALPIADSALVDTKEEASLPVPKTAFVIKVVEEGDSLLK